jgi:hypothetical protein
VSFPSSIGGKQKKVFGENRKLFPFPVSAPGGWGPSLSTTANSLSTKPWFDILGPMLEIHDGHSYATFDRFMLTFRMLPTGDVLRGITSIGLYFSVDWCPSCTTFTPILNKNFKARRAAVASNMTGIPFQVVLISRCKTKWDTHNFFGRMPWMALPHIDSMEMRRQSLMNKFGTFDTGPMIGSAPLALPLPTQHQTQVTSTAQAGEPRCHHMAPSEETPLADRMDV